MDNSILLNTPNARFESHLWSNASIPFHYHRDVVRRQMVLNIHENIELLFFLEGAGQVVLDGNPQPVEAGDLAVINSYVTHQVKTDGHLVQFCLIIDNGFCRYHGIDPTALVFSHLVRDEQARILFRGIMDALEGEDPFREAAAKSAVLATILHLCRGFSQPRTQPLPAADPALGYVCTAGAFIKGHLSQKLTADAVANAVGLSKFHFLREFKRITGFTLTHYINALRCEKAQRLLEQGDRTVKEAAHLCGFSNPSYFTDVFFQYTGMLPSEILPKK